MLWGSRKGAAVQTEKSVASGHFHTRMDIFFTSKYYWPLSILHMWKYLIKYLCPHDKWPDESARPLGGNKAHGREATSAVISESFNGAAAVSWTQNKRLHVHCRSWIPISCLYQTSNFFCIHPLLNVTHTGYLHLHRTKRCLGFKQPSMHGSDLAANPGKEMSRRQTTELNKIFQWMQAGAIAFSSIFRAAQNIICISRQRKKKQNPLSTLAPWIYWLIRVIKLVKGAIVTFSMT